MASENGFVREEIEDVSGEKISIEKLPYEISYINKQNGTYIELHFSLFAEESDAYGHLNSEFEQVHEHKIAEYVNGKEVWTLCPTEHLFYLICHSFKHFLHSGFGIRQVADMIMMAEKYGAQIDWQDINERLIRLNMKKYWDALVCIGVEYLGFDLEKSMYPVSMYDAETDYNMLLADILDSGVYGASSMERKHSSNMTLTAATKGKSSTVASIRNSLFPDMDYMRRRFPWLQKCGYLLPVAYVIRIVHYVKNRQVVDQAKTENSVKIGMNRVEILKRYDIIE